ncbi:MAG: hypothetical protein WBB98_04645 [Xanthobacteraceae bacterium]
MAERKPALLVKGMGGLGDCIRQRAILRQLMEKNEVVVESPFVSVYHDLIDDGLKVVPKRTSLRTQAKNAKREADKFHRYPASAHQVITVNYPPADVRRFGSVMAAMCAGSGADIKAADFRLPVPDEWRAKARSLVKTDRPILVYRPLVDRPSDWGGCKARNPDHDAYAELFNSIRDRFYVVSVADLVPGKEWVVGHPVKADVEFHRGELEFETLAGLVAEAALVYCSPGFAGVLAQAVGTPVAMVFGGYERSRFFFEGAKDAPALGIDPINPCECFSHNHHCQKAINVPKAKSRLALFAGDAIERHHQRAEGGLERVA